MRLCWAVVMLNVARLEVITAVVGERFLTFWRHCSPPKHMELPTQRQHHIPKCCPYILSPLFLLSPGCPNSVLSNGHVQPVYWRWTQHSLYLMLQPDLELQHTINVVKVKVTCPCTSHEGIQQWMCGTTHSYISTRWRWAVSFTFQPLYDLGRSLSTHLQEAGWAPHPVWMFWGGKSLFPLPKSKLWSSKPTAQQLYWLGCCRYCDTCGPV
jgi:hypothetical protein